MRLIIDDQDVPGTRQVAKNLADVSLIALGSSLVHATFPGDLLLGFPVEGVPVADHNPALSQFVEQGRRHDAKGFIIVLRIGRFEHCKTAFDRQAGGDDQDVSGKSRILGISDFVQDMPGNDHGHDDGFARAGRHLRA